MKPFDIELAKQGHPVCTRDGRKARIICFDRKSHTYLIVALVDDGDEVVRFYTQEGYSNTTIGIESRDDLFMMSVKKEGWINVFKTEHGIVYAGLDVYKTKENALERNDNNELIDTVKIEWEE